MTCQDALPLLEAALDGELSTSETLAVETHARTCAACSRRRDSLRALQLAVREKLERFELPARLRRRRLPRPRWSLGSLTAVGAGAAAALVVAGVWPSGGSDEVVSAHVRALQVDHATDVTSTDQHTVKPWFQGKLDFAVPVRDLAAEGFPLEGGRLDLLHGKPAAALVYSHRKHLLDLFVQPGKGPTRISRTTERGFVVFHWARDDLAYWLVGDVAEPELRAFAERLSD